MATSWFRCLLVLCVPLLLGAARARGLDLSFLLHAGTKLRLTERADLRRYENGKFVGLAYREVRGILDAIDVEPAARLDGEFFVFEETKHDARLVAKRIDEVVAVSLEALSDGQWTLESGEADPGYPSLRSFPVFPAEPVEQGESWQAYGVRVVDPFRDGTFTRVRIYADYRYTGTQMREGREVAVVKAQYAMRYKAGDDPEGDARIASISGTHLVTISYDVEASRPSFMSDQTEEQYTLRDGTSLATKGFILTWFDAVEPMDRVRLAEEVTEVLTGGGVEDVEVSSGKRGVTLTVNKLHFVADEATVLPEERDRLALLAEALKKIQGRTFLVVGHTARYGSAESQESLSVERARAIVDYLVSQGIEAKRFIYEGRGSREPVAPNDTEDNMARNRRVEIVILED